MKFIVGITHYSNRNGCLSSQNARGAKPQSVLGWCSGETRRQRKSKMCLVPETPPEFCVDFIASWGEITIFWTAVLCSTGRWWHKHLDIQEKEKWKENTCCPCILNIVFWFKSQKAVRCWSLMYRNYIAVISWHQGNILSVKLVWTRSGERRGIFASV